MNPADRLLESLPAVPGRRYRRPWARWLLAVFAVAAVVSLYFLRLEGQLSWDVVQERRALLQARADHSPALVSSLFFVLYATAVSLSLPVSTGLNVVAGALFDRWLGIVLVSFASTTGASVSFLLSRYFFRDAVERRWGKRLDALQRGVEKEGAYYLLALRLSPWVPFFLVNLGMGLTRMRLRTFWLVSQVGQLPIIIVAVNAGAELREVQTPQDVLSPGLVISLSLVAVVPLALRLLWKWARRHNRCQPDVTRAP